MEGGKTLLFFLMEEENAPFVVVHFRSNRASKPGGRGPHGIKITGPIT